MLSRGPRSILALAAVTLSSYAQTDEAAQPTGQYVTPRVMEFAEAGREAGLPATGVDPLTGKNLAEPAKYPPAFTEPADPTLALLAKPAEARDLRPFTSPQIMPAYTVKDATAEAFPVRDLYTRKGLYDLSFRKHPGLHVGNILGSNSKAAYGMFLVDERQRNIRDLNDTARAMDAGMDHAEAAYILNATRDAFRWEVDNADPAAEMEDAPKPHSSDLISNLNELRLNWVEIHF
jgi:hypothetical protein